MFMAFIIILFVIVLSKCSACSKDKRDLQEEPITLIAPIERYMYISTGLLLQQYHLLLSMKDLLPSTLKGYL